MRWLIAIQSLVFIALLVSSGFCLTYGKPEKIAQISDSNSIQVESEFLKKMEKMAPECVVAIKSLLESKSAAYKAIEADHSFILKVGEALLLLSLFQFVVVVVSIRVNRHEKTA